MFRILALLLLTVTSSAWSQRQEPLPADLEGVGITEYLNASIPLDLEFEDQLGKMIRLGDYFNRENRPVILNLGYYGCPMLCGLVINGMMDGMRGLNWTPGEEYEVVTLSIDPLESHTLAKLKQQNYIKEFGRPSAVKGWHFLTGREKEITELTDAVGFGFAWNDERKEYAHAACLFVCTPDGRISRYLYGIEHSPKDLRLALLEASEGKYGSAFDKILMYCYYYDSAKGIYTPAARKIMMGGGYLAVLGLGTMLFVYWRREAKRKKPSHRGDLT